MLHTNSENGSPDKMKSMEISTSYNQIIPVPAPVTPVSFNKQLFWLIIWMFK